MEIFRLFGSIFVDNDEANKSIAKTEEKAKGVGGVLSEGLSLAGKWGAGLALAAGGAAVALGTTAVNAADDLKKALNGLESSTGISTEKMGGMKDAMLDIYNNNFGESFEDIGKAMATINQQSGASGQELATLTKSAISLRDTFEFEVNESMRAANMLMNQFGMDGEAAYNLIAQGAQYGLDKNGDLLDTINEYSVHFKQMGFDSEEMFNMLVNGAASGTFSVDKLGDAVKEFGIRSKDGSKASTEAFTALGLDAGTLTANFAAGGEKANAAFQQVTTKLLEMKDPVAQNTAGVGLFGTMWEDLGVKGIAALTEVNGEISNSNDALGKINQIKYDSFGEAAAGIGRQLETGVLIPLGEKILPILNTFANWIMENMPVIKDAIGVAMDVVFGAFDMVYGMVSNNVNPIMEAMGEIFGFIRDEYVPLMVSAFQEWIPLITDTITEMWNLVKPIIDGLVKAFKEAWPTIKDFFLNNIETIKGVVTGLLTTLKGIIEFVSGVFTGDWEKAWKGIKDIFGGVWDGLVAILRGAVNNIIILFNNMINSLNRLKFSFPDWIPGMGGKSFSPGIPNIPMLARGGNIGDDGAVMVGERGPEILSGIKGAKVTPLDKASGVTVNIYNPTIMNDRDADRLGDLLVGRLRMLGVT